MPIASFAGIDQIRRIGNDQIETARHRCEQIALLKRHLVQAGQGGIGAGEVERTRVDVGQHQIRPASLRGERRRHAARPGAAADVQNARAGSQRPTGQFSVDQRDETIGIGAEKNRVGVQRGVGRMGIQAVAQRRKANLAAPQAGLVVHRFKQTAVAQPASHLTRQQIGGKRPAPAEDVAQAARRLRRMASIDASMRCRRDGGEPVALGPQPATQQNQRIGEGKVVQGLGGGSDYANLRELPRAGCRWLCR